MKRFFAISFLLISAGLAQREPEWIFEMPSDEEDNFYWARVNVFISDLDEEEYKSKANIEALQNISMQIRTTVAGQSKSILISTEKWRVSLTQNTFGTENIQYNTTLIQQKEVKDMNLSCTK